MVETSGTRELINPAKIRHDLERFIRGYPLTARMQHYKNGAIKRLESEQDPRVRDLAGRVIKHADRALQAAENGDLDHFAQEFERVIRHSIILQLPEFEEAIKTKLYKNAGEGKKGHYGPVKKIIKWLYLNSTENTDIFEKWRKTRKIIETGNGEKWSLFAHRIDETIDALGNVKPEDYEYFYADRSGEDPEDDEAQIIEIPVTVGSIKTALSRIRKDI